MKWFQGSISEAVTATKLRKAVFVVFIEGKDEESTHIARVIDNSEISSRLEQENFVAIKLESDSDNFRFFAQMYKLVPVPSIFFINNGIPIEIIAGKVSIKELISKIDTVTTNARLPSTTLSHDVGSETPSTSKTVDPVPQTSTSETRPKDNNNDPTIQEKLERAKLLIDLQNKQKQEEAERKEKENELERRKIGRDVQKMRQMQQDLQIKQAYDERMKEKAAELAARERVRLQIAQDKLERKQKDMAMQEQNKPVLQEQPMPCASTADDNATITRIQFRLPTGNPHMNQFQSSTTLGSLRNYVLENMDLPFRQFSMFTSFPRRELNDTDNDKTLLELELVPNAVIFILPLRNSNETSVTTPKDVGFISQFVWILFAPIIGVYNFVMGYFTGGQQTNASRSTNRRDNPASRVQNPPSYPSRLTRRNFGNQGGSSTIRAEGNIHRLHSGGDDDDENNTWNGNSTQQM